MSRHHPTQLETVSVTVPETATEAYEAALASACASVGFFRDHATGDWRIEGVKEVATGDGTLVAALALAEGVTGVAATLERRRTPAEGWLARTRPASRNSISASGSPCAARTWRARRRRDGSR